MRELKRYQKWVLEVAMDVGALRFGEFTLKSGRKSPYFFNAGLMDDGFAEQRVSIGYAHALTVLDVRFDRLFGPAYKGIGLAGLAALGLWNEKGRRVQVNYNRKEKKDHGEGGVIVGRPMTGMRTMIIDDVISAGTAVRESLDILQKEGALAVGVGLILDRQEKGGGTELSAVQQVEQDLELPVTSILTLDDVFAFLQGLDPDHIVSQAGADGGQEMNVQQALTAMAQYRDRYGAA